jgi:hypothetical protein
MYDSPSAVKMAPALPISESNRIVPSTTSDPLEINKAN